MSKFTTQLTLIFVTFIFQTSQPSPTSPRVNQTLNFHELILVSPLPNQGKVTGEILRQFVENGEFQGLEWTLLNSLQSLKLIISNQEFREPLILTLISLEVSNTFEILSLVHNSIKEVQTLKKWSPIFILMKSNGNDQLMTNSVQNLSSLFTIQDRVYILGLGGEAPSLHEIFSIKDLRVVRELDLEETYQNNWSRDISLGSVLKLVQKHVFISSRDRGDFGKVEIVPIAQDLPDFPMQIKLKYRVVPDKISVFNKKIIADFDSGFLPECFWYLRDALNFSYSRVKVSKGFMRPGKGNRLTGAAIPLNAGKGDIVVESLEFVKFRMRGPDGITFLHPIFETETFVFFKQPPANTIRNLFRSAFTPQLWLSVFLVWIIIVSALRVVVGVMEWSRSSVSEERVIGEEALMWAVGAVCQQGWYRSPGSPSTRIIFLFGFITGVLTHLAYSAALVSILSIDLIPIKSMEDLLTEKFHITSDSRLPTAQELVKSLEDEDRIPKLPKGSRVADVYTIISKLQGSRQAFVTSFESLYPVLRAKNLSSTFVCEGFTKYLATRTQLKGSFFVKRGSPFREFFNRKLLLMRERGIKDRLMSHYRDEATWNFCRGWKSSRSDQIGESLEKIELRDVLTAFIIWGTGTVLSLIGILIEKWWIWWFGT